MPRTAQPSSSSFTLKVDTGASQHYIKKDDKKYLQNCTASSRKNSIFLPDGHTITSTYQGQLPLPSHLAAKTKVAKVLPSLHNSLLSIGQLCDDNCIAVFHKRYFFLLKNLKVLLRGLRNFSDGLWDVTLPHHKPTPTTKSHKQPCTERVNIIVPNSNTKTDLAKFFHASLCSPVLRTLQLAIRNDHLLSWPGIDKINFDKFITDTIAIDKGHLDHERKNLRSTSKLVQSDNIDLYPVPKEQYPITKQYSLYSKIVPFTAKEMAYGDITGAFPYTSSRGSKYIYVMYDYDANAILTYPLKSRQAHEITSAWKTLHAQMTRHGHNISNFILDNECSGELRKALAKNSINFQLVPPDAHRRNAAERAIRTFKNHFLSTLATCHSDFPITEWDRLLPQSQMTLNLLRAARCNPNLSAYAYLAGEHNYNKVPLAPPGTRVFVHAKPNKRKTWAFHGQLGWYVGPAIHHYRCFRVYLPQTGREIITDTLKFIPESIPFPTETIEQKLSRTLDKIILILNSNQQSPVLATVPKTKDVATAFSQVRKILHNQLPFPTSQDIGREPRVEVSQKPAFIQQHKQRIPVPKLPAMPKWPKACYVSSNPHVKYNFKYYLNHIFDNQGKKRSIDSLLQDNTTNSIWSTALENEVGRLSQGFKDRVKAQDAMDFIYHNEIPTDRKVTYANFVCDYRPLKSEKFRVRMTVGGDKLDYFDNTSSPTASLVETKLLINSVISDHKSKNSRFCSMDLKDFFLTTPMDRAEYIRINARYFSTAFRTLYNLHDKIHSDGYIYCKIKKGMYGLKQAAILAYKLLLKRLALHGYIPIPLTDGLFKHKTRPTIFALCVDDFGVKYNSDDDLLHLQQTLKTYYDISVDKDGRNYCGLTLTWNYQQGYVDISMPHYVTKALKKFNHPHPLRPQHAPHKWTQPAYGQKVQYAREPTHFDKLDTNGKRRIQSIVGTFLYYGRAVEQPILPALNEIATYQATPTTDTVAKTKMLMDFLATHPNAKLRYYAGTMHLHVESDAAYLVLPGARSRIAGYFYLQANPHPTKVYSKQYNAPIHVECSTIKNVVSSAAEAECGGLFFNCGAAIGIRNALIGMGHPQGKTPVITDNSTAKSFVHSEMRVKRSKSWDMKYNWLRDRAAQQQFNILWDKGTRNMADYFTKHHPPTHHKIKRYDYILKGYFLSSKKK